MMKRMILCLLLAMCGMVHAQPNIIFVLTDDMGWGDWALNGGGAKGTPHISTPNLNAMARGGAQLLSHYTCAPVCAPARASLFTGVHQGHAQVIRNNNFDAPLENVHTLASVLRDAGYSTALIGKWGLAGGRESGGSPDTCPAWPTQRGFDYFFGYANHLAGHRHYPKEEPGADPEFGGTVVWDGDKRITDNLDGCYTTDLFTARAKKWITDHRKENADKPFFLALTFTAPHARLGVPTCPYPAGGGLKGGVQWTGKPGRMINTADAGKPDSFIYPQYRNAWKSYAQKRFGNRAAAMLESARRHATMITRVDDAMGDLVKLCRDLGIDRNTVIVFTSDNGPHDEPGAVPYTPAYPCPTQNPAFFRSYGNADGIKRDIWNGGVRVPCVVYGPGTISGKLKCNTPTQFQDWMATLADLAGTPIPMRCDGYSLLPMLRNKPAAQNATADRILYSEYFFPGRMASYIDFAEGKRNGTRGEQQMLIFRNADGGWLKAVRTGITSAQDTFAIYDPAADPQETKNLAGGNTMPTDADLLRMTLYNRRAFDYVRRADAPRRNNGISGSRCYDNTPVPADADTPAGLQPGLRTRQLAATPAQVPQFDSLQRSLNSTATTGAADPNSVELPAGSVTEFRGYLNIPQDGVYHFYLTLDDVSGSKAFARMHNFHLIDADCAYTPGSTATESSAAQADECDAARSGHKGIPLSAGLHEITLTVVQGTAPGKLKLEWSCGQPDGSALKRQVIPASAFVHAPVVP